MGDNRGLWPSVDFPAQPTLGKVNVGSGLTASRMEGDTLVVIYKLVLESGVDPYKKSQW